MPLMHRKDTHGTLKEQFRRLCDYAEQMEFEAVGSSSDCGGRPLMKPSGIQTFHRGGEREKSKCPAGCKQEFFVLFFYTAGTDTGYGRISKRRDMVAPGR